LAGRSDDRIALRSAPDCGKCEARSIATGLRGCFFCIGDGHMILLHGFIKKTQKTPATEIQMALRRMKEGT